MSVIASGNVPCISKVYEMQRHHEAKCLNKGIFLNETKNAQQNELVHI